jgi:hypothetical protein
MGRSRDVRTVLGAGYIENWARHGIYQRNPMPNNIRTALRNRNANDGQLIESFILGEGLISNQKLLRYAVIKSSPLFEGGLFLRRIPPGARASHSPPPAIPCAMARAIVGGEKRGAG